MNKTTKKLFILIASASACIILSFLFVFYADSFSRPAPVTLTEQEQSDLKSLITSRNPPSVLHSLPYPVIPADLPVQAYSAFVIDAKNGCILYEKNADTLISPASMTKLVAIYVVLEEAEKGNVSLSDIVPLRKESWAKNAPPDSSLMFLGEGQKVSLDELITGMAVVSGNDAAVAAAQYVSGSVEKFVERMNTVVQSIGLKNTRFVECTGYSERNVTTAREFAAFCRRYLEKFPKTLEKYHSLTSFTYPKAQNLKEGLSYSLALQSGSAIEGTLPVTQNATNKILGKIEGADGLKTGFIYESGYNLALTVQRGSSRFISVTMGGPGKGSIQGNEIRLEDSKTIMDWAFSTFSSVSLSDTLFITLPVFGGKQNALYLVEFPYYSAAHTITVPLIASYRSGTVKLERVFEVREYINAPVQKGDVIGYCKYMLGDICIEQTELISDRSIEKSGILKTALDSAAELLYKKKKGSRDLLPEQYRIPQTE